MHMSGILATLSKIPSAVLGNIVGDKALGLSNVGLFEMFQAQFKDVVASTFSAIEDSHTDELMSISPRGITDIIAKFMESTLWVSVISNAEIAGELFGEMIQEGISNAIQTSLGGAIQTLLNVRRGAFPAMQDYNVEVGRVATEHDSVALGFVSASVGCNLMTTAFDLIRGANQEIENRFNSLLRVVENVSAQITTHALGLPGSVLLALQTIVTRLILMPLEVAMVYHDVVRRIAEEHLARLNELEDSLEAIRMYYENEFIDESMAELEALKVKAEIEASITSYNEFIESVQNEYSNAIAEVQSRVAEILNAVNPVVKSVFEKLCAVLNSLNIANPELKDEYLTKIRKIFYSVVGYRDMTSTNINIE